MLNNGRGKGELFQICPEGTIELSQGFNPWYDPPPRSALKGRKRTAARRLSQRKHDSSGEGQPSEGRCIPRAAGWRFPDLRSCATNSVRHTRDALEIVPRLSRLHVPRNAAPLRSRRQRSRAFPGDLGVDGVVSRARVLVLAGRSGVRMLVEISQSPPMRAPIDWRCVFCSLLAALFLATWSARAAEENQPDGLPALSPGAKISLVTCSPGDELYTAFGHSAIRILDPELGFDRLYNFGTFDMSVGNFYLRFARGDLLYQLSVDQGAADIEEHGALGQGVTEAQLNLTPEQKQYLFAALETNLAPENRYYRYDFLLDNCSTRVRDVFEKIIGTPVADKTVAKVTFRQMLDPYLERIPWIRFGIYLLLGAGVDRLVQPREACFLPANLESATCQTKVDHDTFGQEPVRLFSPRPLPRMPRAFDPEIVFSVGLVAWIALWALRGRKASRVISAVIYIVFGFTGLFLVVLAANTLHWEAYQNWNVAWLVPTHLVAGLGLLFFPANKVFMLRLYLFLAMVEALVFMVSSPWLPQQFHPAIYPLIVLLIWRTVIELRRKVVS
jgi:hypothetical protein